MSILIIEDEPDIREMLQWGLGNQGHQVMVAADGKEALEKIRQEDFEVVVSDIRIPGIDGLEVLRATKDIAPATEVVMMTAYAELQYAIECIRGGAFDFIQKPLTIAALNSTIDRALQHRRRRAAAAL